MKLLAIDTSTPTASVAITRGDDTLVARHDDGGDHSDRLIGIIDDTLNRAGETLDDLDAIAFGAGPGSFTGLRIGMATAKGLAYAADKPLWVVSSLRALAMQVSPPPSCRSVAAITDARRREVFVGLFDLDGTPLGSERVVNPANLGEVLTELGGAPSSTFLVGEGLSLYPDSAPTFTHRSAGGERPDAVGVARAARVGERVDGRKNATPAYIRPSEAEVRFPHGNPGGTFAPRAKTS